MGDPVDRPGPVRRGEELDLEALAEYLRREHPNLLGKAAQTGAPLEAEQFGSGYSNLTYQVTAGDRRMVLRRPPFGSQVATAHDMEREFRVLGRVRPLWKKVPKPLALCDDPAVLGSPFYLMERVEGVILRRDPPPGIDLGPAAAEHLADAFVDTLAQLHGLDLEATGLAEIGRPEGYVQRQVEGWVRRYRGSQTGHIPELEEVADWLAGRLGEITSGPATLVHNDFKYDNLVLDPADVGHVRAVLDWEMATVGDPLMDLGTSLGYWVEAGDPEPLQRYRFGPTQVAGSPTRRQLAYRYADRTGRDLGQLTFYYVFGLFKIAVIAQQIYYRYVQGLTRDERFAPLDQVIHTLGRVAAKAAETSMISPV